MIEVYGFDKNNKSYHDQLFQGGGQGGSIHRDGKSGVLYPTSAANTSVEMFENRAPILVICKEFVIDSAGAGYKRGGLGQIVKIRKLYDDKIISKAGIYPNGIMSPTNGLFGGKPSLIAKAWLINKKNKTINLGIGGIYNLISTKEIACLRLAGGSGYGNPYKRQIEEIQQDLKEEYISLKKAIKDYGYSIR
jgi:5-oxoprolinase (ATP-hydrolysing)/N-methylhydantoinase A